ncbi:MAG TPA: amino acid adenylation domain-containing protein [Pyrinomonadaceae bacterium]|nr:amino acid adenylation domain-containing protein [Pyrinomonadaceae bacterium]
MDATILVTGHSARPRLEWQSLVELLRSRAETEGPRRLYTFLSEGTTPEQSLSYAELDRRARAIGACLQDANAQGQRVLLLFPPGLDYIAAFFGCLYANAVAVPAYPPRQNRNLDRLRAVVHDARPAIALTTQHVIAELESGLDHYADLKALRWIAADRVEPGLGAEWRDLNADANTLAFLQYTSGSTANPKGVMVTHGNLLHNEELIQRAFGQSSASIIVGWLPLFHDMGLIGNVIQPLYAGAECVLFSPMGFLQKPFRWLEAISRYRATTSGGPNFAYDLCVRKISPADRETLDLSSWTVAFNGAEPVRKETIDRFCAAFEPCGFRREAFFPCYGLAEATLFVAGGPGNRKPVIQDFQRAALDQNRVVAAGTDDVRSLVSCGHAPEHQVMIVDPESNARCLGGHVGEIWVNSESVAQGYWNQPEESNRIFKAHLDTGEGPYLRTGDLGFVDDGQLYITGRLKDLIIIRGRNCYPEDIEHTIGQCARALRPGEGVVFSADIAGDERLVVVHEIARDYRGDNLPEVVDNIRRSVAEEHDLQLFHVALITPGSLLRTSSGKIRRQAMKKVFLEGKLRVLFQWQYAQEQAIETAETAPADFEAVREWIVSRVAAVVGMTRGEIDHGEPIVRYGMDSLACMELAHAIEEHLGASVPVTALLSDLSVSEIAQRVVDQLSRVDGRPGDRQIVQPAIVTPQTSFPLADGQAALWFLHRVAPQSAAYNVMGAARLRGVVDAANLRSAFQTLLDRHPLLRARFETREGKPAQVIQESVELAFHEENVSATDLRGRVREEAHRPFDLENGPVIRLALFTEPGGERLLMLVAHHIVIDMWSVAVLVKELKLICEAGDVATLSPHEFSYHDFVAWQQHELSGARGQELQQYWLRELSGELPVLNLNTDHPRPYLQTFAGASASIRLRNNTVDRLHELSRDSLLSIHSVLLAAYAALLYRHTNQEEVIVGCPASGRTDRRFQSLVGYFVNPVPVRIRLNGAMTFRQLLAEVRETVQRAFAHQDYPFARIVEDVCSDRDTSRSPVFQTSFVFEQPPAFIDRSLSAFVLGEEGAQLTLGSLTLESVKIDQAISQFDLSLVVALFQEELLVALQYNTGLFEAATIERMLGHFSALVEEVTQHPDQKISAAPILTTREREQLFVEFNDTRSDYARHDCMHRLFEAQVEKTPHAIGLVYEGGTLSYAELNAKANRLARHLQASGVGPDARVAILLQRSPEMIVAMLAVLKAGGAYVPLDPAYPADRLAFMLDDSEASALICQETLANHLTRHQARVINLDRDDVLIAQHDDGNPHSPVKPENLSHVIYTSGSTGRPKGVAIEHGDVIHFLHWAYQSFSAEELSGVFASTSICFDLSVFEIFGPLTCGGAIILANDALHLGTHSAAKSVTLINTVPSAMTELLRLGAVGPNVLTINLAGEALKNSLVQQIYAETKVRRVFNLYGPTEYTTYTTGVEVQRGSLREPTIGRPIANTRVYIVNDDAEPVPLGVPGEICVGGDGLARCYLNRPEMTAERFIPDNLSSIPGSRLYRTGDVGRYLDNGEIEYLGRKDHQIKLRGYRIELGEIELALLRYPGIKEAVAVAREDHLGEKQLVAYLVTEVNQQVSDDDLRYYLRKSLPGFMVPQFFVTLAAMPLTSNGKVDRLSLPAPAERRGDTGTGRRGDGVTSSFRERGPIEEVVANTWGEVLGVQQIGSTDNFFDIGGQSLKAVQVVARLSNLFRIELPVTSLFEAPTVQALARVVERSLTCSEISRIERVSRDRALPLSFAQQRLWFLQRLEPSSTSYNISFSARFVGPLNLRVIEESINEIVRRHEALRTTFTEIDSEPVQIIAPSLVIAPSIVELDQVDEAEIERLLREEACRPFDLERGPLVRTTILRLSGNECVVSLSMHHAISDGWSGGVFIRELIAIYDAVLADRQSPLPELEIQYADFAHWQRQRLQQDDFQSQLSYWREQLTDVPQLDLPVSRTRPPVRSEQGAALRFNLPKELAQKLRAVSGRNGATLFMTLLAALQVLLSRYSSQTDVAVGTPVANRNSAEIEPLIGCFVNTLVMRTDLSGNPTFRELLERVRNVALGAYTHSEVPFERLVSELQPDRDLSRTPLFQVMMVLQNTPQQSLVLGGLNCQLAEIDNGTAKFDLTVQLTESEDGLDGKWEYSTDLFDEAAVERMVDHFRVLLEGVVENEQRRISELPILTNAEQSQLHGFNRTQLTIAPSNYLHHAFETQVEKTPNAVALVSGPHDFSYQELNRRANRLARYLQTLSVGPETRVGLLLDRSPEMIVSLLAVLKAGGAYVPLDLNYPAERLSFMIEDTRAAVMICNDESVSKFSNHSTRVVNLDRESHLIAEQSDENPISGVGPENLSHVIYTSGSTGRPKGVAIEHRSVISFLQWAQSTFSKEELAGVLASTSICFDLSVFEIFAPLSVGGAVVLAGDALQLANHAAAERVTLINTVPSAMTELLRLQAVPQGVLSVNLAGEALKGSLVRDIYSQTNVRSVRNLYGPTEYTTYSTGEDVERGFAGEPTIGQPIANTHTYILDQQMSLLPIGVTGEIWIGGHGLARGYLNRPELTADRFLPDSLSGNAGARLYRTGDLGKYLDNGKIEYLGRKDHQVKLRGYRIELGEIEIALEQLDSVNQAVVVVAGDQRLVAYLVSASGSNEAELRRSLEERLPSYMVPSIFVFLDHLPLTANGKVDRRALPAPERLRPDLKPGFVEGRSVTEQLLVQIWSEVLKVEAVGINDNFFDLGGHSLLAAQVVSRIRAAFQVELPLRRLFEAPTVRTLAEAIESQVDGRAISMPIDRVSRDAALPLSFAQQRLWFLDQLEPNNSAYNLSLALRMEGPLNIPALQESLTAIVRRHEVLRTSFVAEDGPPQQVIAPDAAVNLQMLDLRESPASAREDQARHLLAEDAQRPFNLTESSLLRLTLLQLEDDVHWLSLVAHHIIADGWSVGIFARELTQLYRAFSQDQDSPLSACAIQYADFAAWQRNWLTGQRLADELGYWKEQLSGAPALLELPTDHPRPAVQTFRGANVTFRLSSASTKDLKTMCRAHAVTPFMALTAAFALLLSRYSRQSDVCIGTPVAGRTRLETEDLIGLFVNTLVLRTQFSDKMTLRDLLAHVRETTLQAHAHQSLPFEKLVDELQPDRTLSYSPLFQAMCVQQDAPTAGLEIEGLSLTRIEAEAETAQFDLTLRFEERGGEFAASFEYNTDLFERETIERMTRHFQQLLGSMMHDTEQQAGDVTMLGDDEREQLIVEWNRQERQHEVAGDLIARFERAVERSPEAIALNDGDEKVSYRELNRRANQLGHYLRRHGVGPEVRVGLLVDRSIQMIVNILGVLKAGGVYVPFELSAPADRIAFMLQDSGAALLLTEKQQLQLIDDGPSQILALDELSAEITDEPETNLGVPVSKDNAAYMIYTSGSTGRPKGVIVTHENVLRLLRATEHWYGFDGKDVWTMFHSYAFDVSVWELWGALLYGGRLAVVPYWVSRTPEAYYELLQREQVTVLNQTPSAFRQVQPLLEEGSAGQIRLVIFAGEALELNSLRSWYERFGDDGPQLVNMYGITETTVHSTYRPLRQADVIEARGSMVGRRIPDLEIYLLDERQRPVPIGVPGELYVGGAGVARGYLNRPELTSERFIAHPFSTKGGERLYRSGDLARYLADGDIEYLGRIDHQVKIRGFRVETGEIEAVLTSHPSVRKAVVIPKEFEAGHKYLAAYITGAGGPGTDELRAFLEQRLPGYMVPAMLMWVDEIKLTINGKVDRRSLPEPTRDSSTQEYVPPGSPAEKILASIWQNILRVERVGVNDNFFELGGDSILTTHIVAAARRAGLHVTPQQFFQQQTLGKLALVAEEAVPDQQSRKRREQSTAINLSQDEVNNLNTWTDLSNVEDTYPLTSFQQGILFHVLDKPSTGVYLNQQSYTLQGELDVEAFQKAFQEVVNRHQILRTGFILSAQDGPLQMVFRQVSMPWAMYDWRDLSPAEADEHLAALQQAEYELGFELSRAPLMRATLVRRDTDLYEFIWSYHLLLLDGASGVVVFKELLAFYESFCSGKPVALKPSVRYGDYIDWLQKQEQGEAETYWRNALAQFSSPTSVGFDRSATTNSTENGAGQKGYTEKLLLLDHALSTELRSLAAREHLTLNTLIQGAWTLLLSRRSGSDDIVFGSTVSGRVTDFTGAESTVGLFVNVLPVRVRVPRDEILTAWLTAIQSQQAEARRYEYCSLANIQGWSEVPRGLPLFESVLIFQNIPLDIASSESVGLKVLGIKTTERTNVPLAVIVEPGEQLRFRIVYQRSRLDDVTIDRIAENLQRTLTSITANSAAQLSTLSSRQDEKASLIQSFNQSF